MGKRRTTGLSRGFTMVEVLVVVIIIGVLATLIVPKLFGRTGMAKINTAKANLPVIEQAVDLFRNDYGRYPQSLDELVARPSDVPEGKWVDPTIKAKNLADPWERPYQYKCPGDHDKFDLYSLGADGQEGGEGENADVVNW